ncbi:Uncharacterised protein [Vibrio cholerae]|nr:Uncharacterised protein [Vibrio cholerae]CSI49395.1 Uncharacterised protein [Vibrio cholerae]
MRLLIHTEFFVFFTFRTLLRPIFVMFVTNRSF